MQDDPLKLAAADAEDLDILSALLQDAVVPPSDMTYIPSERRFVLVACRFRWENVPRMPGRIYERVRCGIAFDRVSAVRHRNFDRRERMFDMLALEAGDGYVDLVFAGGATVRLVTDRIVCHAEDFGEPWPTRWRPDHSLDDGKPGEGE